MAANSMDINFSSWRFRSATKISKIGASFDLTENTGDAERTGRHRAEQEGGGQMNTVRYCS
jgi:hypothetical protein